MRYYRLKITEKDFEELKDLVFGNLPLETGAFALAGVAEFNNGTDILIRRPIAIPKEMMPVQNEYHLELTTQAINGLISLCEANSLGAVFCHSHNSGLLYSPSDDYGEQRIANVIRKFIPSMAPIASLLFSPDGVTGRIWLPDQNTPISLNEIIILGRSTRRIQLGHRSINKLPYDLIYDRQVRAFGTTGQVIITKSKVGIVGLGGTGSPIAEQLARLGVKDFVLVDPDHIDPSNLTRVYGTFSQTIKRAQTRPELKVNIIKDQILRISPKSKVLSVPSSVVVTKAAENLVDRDIIFLCTDEHWGRSIVTQIAYQYMIPTINLGARISSDNGTISHAVGTIDILRPDLPCLWCKQFLSPERIAAESMPVGYRKTLHKEGYVDDIDTETPSVISLTSTIASMAVSLFLQQMTDFMGSNGEIYRLNFNMLDGQTWRGKTNIKQGCVCQKSKALGNLGVLPTISELSLKRAQEMEIIKL